MNDVVVSPIELEEVAATTAAAGDPLVERNLGLLGHVNVRLNVLLGGAEISIERLFALAKGDSITLDAELDAPVILQLDDKPIARGHLLAVGDRFGLKIAEIL